MKRVHHEFLRGQSVRELITGAARREVSRAKLVAKQRIGLPLQLGGKNERLAEGKFLNVIN